MKQSHQHSRGSEHHAVAAAGADILCILLRPAEVRQSPIVLKWAVCRALRSPNGHATVRFIVPAAMRFVLSTGVSKDDQKMLDVYMSKIRAPTYVLSDLYKTPALAERSLYATISIFLSEILLVTSLLQNTVSRFPYLTSIFIHTGA